MTTYEALGSGTIHLSGSGSVAGANASMAMSSGQITIQPPYPHNAYHLPPDHFDLTGQGVMLSFAMGGVVAVFRVVNWR